MKDVTDGLIIGAGSVWVLNLLKGKARLTKTAIEAGILLAIIMGIVNGADPTTSRGKAQIWIAAILAYPYIPSSVRRIVSVFTVSRGLALSFPNIFEQHQLSVSWVSNLIVLGAFLKRPDLLSKGYLKFLERFGNQHGSDFEAFRSKNFNDPKACYCMHPGTENCVLALPAMFWDMFINQSLPLYSRLYGPLVALSVIQGKGGIEGGIKRTIRSAVTLSTYTSTVLSVCCVAVKIPGNKGLLLPLLATTAGTGSFLIEPTHRQYQLSQFMMGHCLDVIVRFYESLALPVPPHAGRMMFASGLYAMVMNLHKPCTSSTNRGLLRYIMDTPDSKHVLQPTELLMSIFK